MQCQADELGFAPNGCKVTAATDDAGPQVIVVSSDGRLHLLSRPLADHAAAVELGKRVVAEGTGIYTEWTDLNDQPFMALFDAALRRQVQQ